MKPDSLKCYFHAETARMARYVYAVLSVGWLAWFSAFLTRKRAPHARKINKQARWGILLEGVGFAMIWQGRFWAREPGWKLVPAAVLLVLAATLSWTGVAALGRQWRVDAGLNPDHQLIRSGPYSFVRHPIYASMLCLMLGTGLILTPFVLFVPAVCIFLVGTEIRVRIEDALLAAHFGEHFTEYKRKVPAYIPWLR
jgi:protein-S-isoprenylcysteine O-methyltransferase Ste14